MEYLLLIHIGPVQDFIATARRSRDLWFGSRLLSELSKAAAKAIVEKEGKQLDRLIFPAVDDVSELEANSDLIVANKIVTIVQELPSAEAVEDYIHQAILYRLNTIRRQAYKAVKGRYDKAVIKAQVNDLPEYFWVTVPFEADRYDTIRAQAEAMLTARKLTRDFKQVTWGGNVPKSSLDGVRESVIPEDVFPSREDNEEERQKKIDKLYTDYGARPAERLSGIDLMKRHGYRGLVSGFPSTSHIASLPYRCKLEQQTDLVSIWRKYINSLPAKIRDQERVPEPFDKHPVFGNSDGSLLFKSRLVEYEDQLSEQEMETAKEKLNCFLQQASNGQEPLPYYALLLADGDGMGDVIDAQKTQDQHRKFSQTLSTFAGEAQKKVTAFNGAVVYAGGDDLLAFVPLHTVLMCAKEVAQIFRNLMNKAGFVRANGEAITFSAGIVVSHHLEPLSDALSLVRETERTAKDVDGKNALAISVDMRSGVARTVAGHWGELDTRLAKFIELHRQEEIPDGAAYQLRDTALRLGGQAVIKDNATLQDVAQMEGLRILTRKRAQRGSSKLSQTVFKELKELIKDQTLGIEQLADELIIARLFAKAEDQAYGSLKPTGGA